MSAPVRKLRGAQRVAALQADVERRHAEVVRLRAIVDQARGDKQSRWPWQERSADEEAHRQAQADFRTSLLVLHSVSPKRALAVADKLGLVQESWLARHFGEKHSELEAGPLPVRGAATQRTLRKMRERNKQRRKE